MNQSEAFIERGWRDPIFRVSAYPTGRIQFLRIATHGFVGDYAWHTKKLPEDEFIHATGYSLHWRPIWYADFAPGELEFVCEKPNYSSGIEKPLLCPFPVATNETA